MPDLRIIAAVLLLTLFVAVLCATEIADLLDDRRDKGRSWP